MSAWKSWTICCDHCSDSDGGDLGAETAQERRDDISKREPDPAYRWHCNLPGGRDVCGDCWARGLR